MKNITRNVLAAVIALGFVQAASAQQGVAGPRWQGWIGCWTAVSNTGHWDSNNGAPPTVCVLPTQDVNAVDVVTLADGKVAGRDRIDASGQSRALGANGCTGSEQARFSADGRRVFLRSSVDCQGSKTQTSALLAITSAGEWIDVRDVSSGGAANVKVARYRDAGTPRDLPADVATALAQRNSMGAAGARVASGATFGNDAIIEAVKFVNPGVVEGWVMESGQRFAMDSWSLAQLADAGVPGSVTDAMIEASNPQRAESSVYRYGRYTRPYGRGASDGWDQDTGERITVYAYPSYDPWGFGWGYGYPIGYYPGNGRYVNGYTVGFGPGYGYGYGYGLGYGYGFGYGSGYSSRGIGYYPPVIVLHQSNGGGAEHGQAVKGEGYSPGRTAQATPGTSGSPAAPGSSSGATAAAQSQPKPPAQSSGSRTAKTRP